MKRIIAIAAFLCLAQPAQANLTLIEHLAMLRLHIATAFPQEHELPGVIDAYCCSPSPMWLKVILDMTIGSQDFTLHTILDPILNDIETQLRNYHDSETQLRKYNVVEARDGLHCIHALQVIAQYKSAIAISLGASPVLEPPMGGLGTKRTRNGSHDVRKRVRYDEA